MPQLRNNSPVVGETKRTFVDLIEEFRTTNGLSQRELAERLSVDEAIVSKMLSGDLRQFSIERLLTYARTLYPRLDVKVGPNGRSGRRI